MAHYLEAQYRHDPPRRQGAGGGRHPRALGHSDRAGRGQGRAEARPAQRHHHARRRRLRESRAGLRFSHSLVRASRAPLDAEPCRRADRDHRGLPPARPAGGRSRTPRSTWSSTAPISGASARVRRAASRAGDPHFGPNMVFACRQLFPRKGIRFLIEAAALLKPRFPDLKVVVAGDGFERPELIPLAESLGVGQDVTFLGWVPNTRIAALLSRRGGVRHSVAGGGVRHSRRRGDGLRDAGGGERRGRTARGGRAWRDGSRRPPRRFRRARGSHRLAARGPGSTARPWGVPAAQRALRLFDWDRTAEQFEQIYATAASRTGR